MHPYASLTDKKSLPCAVPGGWRVKPPSAPMTPKPLASQSPNICSNAFRVRLRYRRGIHPPMRGEIDISEALAQLSERDHELCLPVVEAPGRPLVFRRWRIGHPLALGAYGIPVPAENEPIIIPDAVIVPLAAFDAAGAPVWVMAPDFYDATIRALRQAKKNVTIIGAAFAQQQVDAIPAEEHDEKLDAIATEKGIISIT